MNKIYSNVLVFVLDDFKTQKYYKNYLSEKILLYDGFYISLTIHKFTIIFTSFVGFATLLRNFCIYEVPYWH